MLGDALRVTALNSNCILMPSKLVFLALASRDNSRLTFSCVVGLAVEWLTDVLTQLSPALSLFSPGPTIPPLPSLPSVPSLS